MIDFLAPEIFFAAMANQTITRSRTSLLIYITFAVFLVIYVPVIIGMAGDWYEDDNYSHGFLIPLISAYLIWRKRKDLKEAAGSNGDSLGIFFILFGMIIYVLATAAAEYFTLRFSLVATLFGLVWFLYGRRVIKISWFEILFLLFMIPLPYVIYNSLTFPMQLFATKATVKILNLIGMTAVRQGNIIHLPGYSLEVAEACSGLRSLISLLALGAVYARLTQKDILRQVILFASTVPIAIAANIFRVWFTAVGAYTVSKELAEEFLHELSGMMVFIVSFIMLFVWGAIIKAGSKKKVQTPTIQQ